MHIGKKPYQKIFLLILIYNMGTSKNTQLAASIQFSKLSSEKENHNLSYQTAPSNSFLQAYRITGLFSWARLHLCADVSLDLDLRLFRWDSLEQFLLARAVVGSQSFEFSLSFLQLSQHLVFRFSSDTLPLIRVQQPLRHQLLSYTSLQRACVRHTGENRM